MMGLVCFSGRHIKILNFFLPLPREKFILSHRKPFRRNLQGTPADSAIGSIITRGNCSPPEGFVVLIAGVGGCSADTATSGKPYLRDARQRIGCLFAK